MDTPFAVLAEVARRLESLGITYVVVGSFASSTRGLYRATADIDILVDISSEHADALVTILQNDFYLDELAARRAVMQRRSFNAIHFESVFKIDFFVASESEFDRQQLARRQLESISHDISQSIYVATAEDTILAKLKWYRIGGEVSNTQWGDVVGILGTQEHVLDFEYLDEWAIKLNVHDLLEKVLRESSST
jgi:predicted nucleotidyltransferase